MHTDVHAAYTWIMDFTNHWYMSSSKHIKEMKDAKSIVTVQLEYFESCNKCMRVIDQQIVNWGLAWVLMVSNP